MDIDDEIDELITADSSEGNNHVNTNTQSTIKTTNEKQPKLVTRYNSYHTIGNVFTVNTGYQRSQRRSDFTTEFYTHS